MQTMGECELGEDPIRQEVKGEKHCGAFGSAKEKTRIKRRVEFRGECPPWSWG